VWRANGRWILELLKITFTDIYLQFFMRETLKKTAAANRNSNSNSSSEKNEAEKTI